MSDMESVRMMSDKERDIMAKAVAKSALTELVTAILNIPEVEAAIQAFLKDIFERGFLAPELEDAVNTAAQKAMDEYDPTEAHTFNEGVQNVIDSHDFSDAINDAISDHDFSDVVDVDEIKREVITEIRDRLR